MFAVVGLCQYSKVICLQMEMLNAVRRPLNIELAIKLCLLLCIGLSKPLQFEFVLWPNTALLD